MTNRFTNFVNGMKARFQQPQPQQQMNYQQPQQVIYQQPQQTTGRYGVNPYKNILNAHKTFNLFRASNKPLNNQLNINDRRNQHITLIGGNTLR